MMHELLSPSACSPVQQRTLEEQQQQSKKPPRDIDSDSCVDGDDEEGECPVFVDREGNMIEVRAGTYGRGHDDDAAGAGDSTAHICLVLCCAVPSKPPPVSAGRQACLLPTHTRNDVYGAR